MTVFISIFIAGWLVVLVWCVIGNYLYFGKVLPTLARKGLDGSFKIWPRDQLKQADLFVAHAPPDVSQTWYYKYLSRIRTIFIAPLLAFLAMLVAWLAVFAKIAQ